MTTAAESEQPREITDEQKLVLLRLLLAHALRRERNGALCEHEPANTEDHTDRIGGLALAFWTFGYTMIAGQVLGVSWPLYLPIGLGCLLVILVAGNWLVKLSTKAQQAFIGLVQIGWPAALIVELLTHSLNPWVTHGIPAGVFLVPFLIVRGFGLGSVRNIAVTLGALAANAPLLVPVALIVLFVPLFSADLWKAANIINAQRGAGLGLITIGVLLLVLRRQLRSSVGPACSAAAAQIEWQPDPAADALVFDIGLLRSAPSSVSRLRTDRSASASRSSRTATYRWTSSTAPGTGPQSRQCPDTHRRPDVASWQGLRRGSSGVRRAESRFVGGETRIESWVLLINRDHSLLPFEQAYYPGGPLRIGFESAAVTYSDLEVDLFNTGINQVLSAAAVRGHRLLHFSMADLRNRDGEYAAEMAILELDPAWDRADPVHAHRYLRVVGQRTVPLAEIQLFVVRGDDIRTEQTANIEALQWAAGHAKMLESVEATLSTTDKYATIERNPQLPHPVTFPVAALSQAIEAIDRLPHEEPYFVLKDRYGYGCGAGVHRIAFDAPGLEGTVVGYLEDYGHVLVQEFRGEVGDGDLVVTFFDDELIGSLRRTAAAGEWKTNASTGADEMGVTLTPEQESIARALKRSFPECRLASVDMLASGRILEINAFPGGEGLLRNYNIQLGEIVIDRLEKELLGTGVEAAAAALSWKAGKLARFPTGTRWPEVEELYPVDDGGREVYDVLSGDRFKLGIRDLIEFDPRSPEYILSIPHAGVFVPEVFRNRFRLGESALVEIDLYSDLCYEMADGMHIRSELAPFFVDMNRTREGAEEGELPSHLTNPAHEYYTVENRLMLLESYTPEEQEEVLAYYDLYHGLLDRLVDRMRRERGYALLFDCHSMTSTGLGRVHDEGRARADFVAGTLDGSSAHRVIIDAFMTRLHSEASGHGLGLTVDRDAPYSGGFITRNHHDPEAHVHVVQLEVAMDAYMYEAVAPAPKRYALKRPRLRIVRRTVQAAFRAAAEAAEQIYH